MALKDTGGFMAKKRPPEVQDHEDVHIKVESWQWETKRPVMTWKYGLALAVLIAVAILFAFGFLIVAGVVLIIGIVMNLVFFLFKKIS